MKLLTLAITLVSFGAFAQSQELTTMKQKANEHIDKKMDTLRTAKDCIGNANSMDKFKACKYDKHEDMKMQKMEAWEDKKMEKGTEE